MNNHLFKAVAWAIVTIIGICLGFYYLEPSGNNLAMICYFSIAGFLAATMEILSYNQSKKVTRWEE